MLLEARVADNATVVSTSTRNFPNRLGKGGVLKCVFLCWRCRAESDTSFLAFCSVHLLDMSR